jgi:hypothetical protein
VGTKAASVTTGAAARKTDTRFKPGAEWKGNAKGRPKGSRHKLSEAFVADLCATWEEHGIDAIKRVAKNDPASFLRVIASLVPKELTGECGGPIKIMFLPGDERA